MGVAVDVRSDRVGRAREALGQILGREEQVRALWKEPRRLEGDVSEAGRTG
ncbi:hypothetical protein [Georgenia satyanarayanai]|uniref:hypothetical protein n=1 Tax=Georgenia satyanarayanai TaxID=860221 RepID=UPI0015E896DF|nr:hypothetical protein [Georgenia satyanarayanai]